MKSTVLRMCAAAMLLLPVGLKAQDNTSVNEAANEVQRVYYYNFSRWSLGANAGASAVWGDLGSFADGKTYIGLLSGLQLGFQVNPTIGFSLNANYGKNRVGASADNKGVFLDPTGFVSPTNTTGNYLTLGDLHSDIELVQSSLHLDINLNNVFGSGANAPQRRWTTLFSPGIYLQYYRPTVYAADDQRYTTRDLYYGTFVGGGADLALRYRANRIIDLQIKAGGVYGSNAKFDGVAGDNKNNLLAHASVGIVFKLNGKTKKDNLMYAYKSSALAANPALAAAAIQAVAAAGNLTKGDVQKDAKEVVNVVETVVHDTIYIPSNTPASTSLAQVEQASAIPANCGYQVYFDRGQSDLNEVRNDYELLAIINLLKDQPNLKFHIRGYADHTGSDNRNTSLTEERAQALKKYLIGKGIDPVRIISTSGQGKDTALQGAAALSHQARRAEVVIN